MQNVGETFVVIGVGLGLGSQLPKSLLTSLDGEGGGGKPNNATKCFVLKLNVK